MNRKTVFLFVVPLVMLALAACGGGEAADSAQSAVLNEEIVVDMHDIYFGKSNDNVDNPPEWTVTSGAEVVVRMNNEGALEHTWVILEAGETIPASFDEAQDSDKVLISSDLVPARTNGEVRFTAPAPGEYNIVCTVPGHIGFMQGRLIVTG